MSSALLTTFVFTGQAQATANGVHEMRLPVGMQIVGMSLCAEAFTGTPTGFNIDIQDNGTDVITALAANTAGTPGEWKSTHFGGTNEPISIDAGRDVEVDLNLVGGTTPAADYTLVIWALLGTK